MRDTLTGWATEQDGSNSAIWQTTNGGWSWMPLYSPQYALAIYAMGARSGVLVASCGGASFLDSMTGIVSAAAPCGAGAGNGLHGFASTTDGGLTWTPLANKNVIECWGVYGQRSTGKFFIKNDGLNNGYGGYHIYYSSDIGQTWHQTNLTMPPGYMLWATGDIEGSANAIYFQGIETTASSAGRNGIWRSTNGCDSLTFVSGPGLGYGYDTRFWVPLTCNGGIVVASGMNGPFDFSGTSKDHGTWITTDGGDGTLVAVGPPELTPSLSGTASKCYNSQLAVTIKNIQCRGITINTVEVEEKDNLGTFQLDTLSLPFYLDSGAIHEIGLTYIMVQEGAHKAYLHLHGVNDGIFQNPYDTLLAITGFGGPDTGRLVGPKALSVEAPSDCQNADTTIELINTGCGDLTVLSGSINPNAFTMDTLAYPFTLHAGDTLTLHVHYTPHDTKALSGTVSFNTRSNGLSDNAIIQINGSALASSPQATLSALNAGTISICDTTDATIVLKNTGCDAFTVNFANLSQGTAFTLMSTALPTERTRGDSIIFHVHFAPKQDADFRDTLITAITGSKGVIFDTSYLMGAGTSNILISSLDSVNGGNIPLCGIDTLTATIANKGCDTLHLSSVVNGTGYSLLSGDSTISPNASGTFRIVFVPSLQKGPNAGLLQWHLRSTLTGKSLDTSASLLVTVGDGPRQLSADTAPRNFGALFECEERDTTIWLRNPGCDTLTIDNAVFSNGTYHSNGMYPSLVAPGDSLPVKISLTSSASTMNGSVTFYSNANSGSQTRTILLQATALPPAKLRLVVAPSDSMAGGQIVTCYAILDGPIPAGMISSLRFDITHNDDLLSFLKASGVGLTLANTVPKSGIVTQSYTLSPIPNSDTVGTLRFQAYLSDSSSTPLALSNISFTSPRDLPPDCIASIADSGAQFTYVYRCGDRIVQNFMLTGSPFSIESIVPNPAGASLRVEGRGQRVEGELDDAIGRTVLPSTLYALPFTLDVASLPSGTYFLRLSENGYVQTRPVSIER